MEAKRHGNYLILWGVLDYDGADERMTAYFKDPFKAADFALENFHAGVQMILCRPEWNIQTEDCPDQ